MDQTVTLQPETFRGGDHVQLTDRYDDVDTIVVEDRGNLGPRGQRLYRIHVMLPEYEGGTFDFVVLANQLRRVDTPA